MNPISIAHEFLRDIITEGDTVIDATMGNGHDTVFLAGLGARVFAFDVQDLAIANTSKLLAEHDLVATLILDGHENLDKYVGGNIKAAIFNLGYLPHSDKSIITKPHTTITALKKILARLTPDGRVAIVAYPGHAGGDTESHVVEEFAKNLAGGFGVEIKKSFQKPKSPYIIKIWKLK